MAGTVRTRVIFWIGLVFALFQLLVPVLVPLFELQLRALHVMLAVITVMVAVPLARKRAAGLALGVDLSWCS